MSVGWQVFSVAQPCAARAAWSRCILCAAALALVLPAAAQRPAPAPGKAAAPKAGAAKTTVTRVDEWGDALNARLPQEEDKQFAGLTNLIQNGGFENGMAGWKASPIHSLVADDKTPRTGKSCVLADIKEAKFWELSTTARVTKDRYYRLVVWGRGAVAPRLSLTYLPVGGKPVDKVIIEAFKGVGAGWNRYEGGFAAPLTGEIELKIVANFGKPAKPAKLWLDDIGLYEFDFAAPTSVSNGEGFNDFPSMARADDGSLYVAWISHREMGDTLQVARLVADGKGFKETGAWPIVAGKGSYVYAPRVVAAGDGATLLLAAEKYGAWDVGVVPCGAQGPQATIRVTDDKAVDTKPVGAWRDGALWVAWESNRNGSRQILAAVVKDNKVSPAEALSDGAVSSYDPTIAILPDGQVCVAWHSFADNNYDVYLRRRSPSGQWTPVQRLTSAPGIDRHADLFARGQELWIAYEHAQMSGYSIGGTQRKRVLVARVGAQGLEAPKGLSGAAFNEGGGEAAAGTFDESGRLWVAYARGQTRAWDIVVAGCAGAQWIPVLPISAFQGYDRRPSLVIDGSRAIIALQADETPGRYTSVEQSYDQKSDIYLTTLDLLKAPLASAMEFEPLVEPTEPYEAGALRVGYGEDAKTPSIEYKGQTLKLFYGDLHDHTEVSICGRVKDESIDEAYQDMRDIARYDFACVTDHGYNLSPYLWGHTAKMARLNDDPGRFLTFLGEEWTSTFEEYSEEHPYGFYGHRNLVFADPYFPRWWNAAERQTPAQVWEDLRKMNANFVQIPHQIADTGNVPTDWNFTDEVAQPVAEIFQGRGSYEYQGAPRMARSVTPTKGYFIQDAWARGIVIGVIASPDHTGGKGKACVYAKDLSREAILDAIRARHTFGTSAARMLLDVRVNGALMGEKIAAPNGKPVKVEVTARCPGDIDRIEVCRNNEFIYTTNPAGREASFTFVDENPVEGRSYYYVRVVQKDEELGWSSPVWLGFS